MHPKVTLATRVNYISTSWQLRRACDYTRITTCRLRAASRPHRRPMSAAGTTPAAEPSVSAQGTQQVDAKQVETLVAEDLVQYLVLRKDLWSSLKWPLGSIIAQACHASTAALWLSKDSPATTAYCAAENLDHMHKVVLEVKGEQQLHTLSNRLTEQKVAHKLWIEQPENFPTCLATAPCSKAEVQQHFKKFQLCKGF
ncbi:MAG: peptidyl-tRNA hydrolase PTRHD1-like [Trebouxia sp. A1-2]|nr:MAG: peptidyl-tRNA hydrolase PTRHD1-like [Trebouxia sp. A1-2]